MSMGYSAESDPDVSAKASGRDIDVHFKHAVNVCKAIRGQEVPKARAFLEAVIAEEEPVPFFRHQQHAGHRKGGRGPGKYPVKCAERVRQVLENAENNAEYKGLDPDEMRIVHCAAQKAAVLEGMTPRAQGRSSPSNTTMTHIEIIIEEEIEA